MNTELVQQALIDRMASVGAALPPILPNRDATDANDTLPRVEFLPFVRARSGGTLAGGEDERETGRMVVNVVTALDKGTDEAHGYADQIAGLFPEGLRLMPDASHVVTIPAPPEVRGGFRDEVEWKVPVVVFYEAFA